jgi:hypothetical protein
MRRIIESQYGSRSILMSIYCGFLSMIERGRQLLSLVFLQGYSERAVRLEMPSMILCDSKSPFRPRFVDSAHSPSTLPLNIAAISTENSLSYSNDVSPCYSTSRAAAQPPPVHTSSTKSYLRVIRADRTVK